MLRTGALSALGVGALAIGVVELGSGGSNRNSDSQQLASAADSPARSPQPAVVGSGSDLPTPDKQPIGTEGVPLSPYK